MYFWGLSLRSAKSTKCHESDQKISDTKRAQRQHSVTRGAKGQRYGNMSALCRPTYTTLLYSKTRVYRAIQYFLTSALKHRLWVHVEIAVLTCTHNLCFEQK